MQLPDLVWQTGQLGVSTSLFVIVASYLLLLAWEWFLARGTSQITLIRGMDGR